MLKLKLQHFGNLIEKDPDAGKDWRQEKRAGEDEMVRQNHQLSGHEFEQIPDFQPLPTQGEGAVQPGWEFADMALEEKLWQT